MIDQLINFGTVQVSTGYTAAATAIVLTTGNGARWTQTRPFNAVWWNFTDYPNPEDDPNREIVRVTAGFGTDNITVVRPVVGNSYNGEGSSNVASTKNTASKTYKMMPTVTQRLFTTDLFTIPVLGLGLPGAKAVPLFYKGAVVGNHDLYTVPAGKRAWINGPLGYYNSGASGIGITAGVVISATFWKLTGSVFANANTGAWLPAQSFILDAGQTVRVVYDSALQAAVYGGVIEFDNTATMKTAAKFGFGAATNNLIYTCPAGYTALIFNQFGGLDSPGMQLQSVDANVTNHIKYVPSGDTISAQHQVSITEFVSPRNTASQMMLPGCMAAGDSIYLYSDVANASGVAWVNVCEIPNNP